MKRILVPCDFSAPALEAYQFAIQIASKSKGEIFVLKAIELPVMLVSGFDVPAYSYEPMMMRELEADATAKFKKMQERFPSGNVPVNFKVTYEGATPAIRDFTKSNQIDLVVMGTKGTGGISEYVFGSNTEKVVRLAPVPVFAIKKSIDLASIRKIVLPTNLDLKQTDFIQKVQALQTFLGATLEILWINTPSNFKRENESRGELEEFVKHFKLKNATTHTRNDTFEEDAIAHFVKEVNADIVAMATHGRRGLLHHLTGSIAEDVVNHIECPIWTFTRRKPG
ncbi:MAG: universal stress protein [Cytophagales bacterium]|nr:universal stress protein [Cytophagales bacterium]